LKSDYLFEKLAFINKINIPSFMKTERNTALWIHHTNVVLDVYPIQWTPLCAILIKNMLVSITSSGVKRCVKWLASL